MNAATHQTAIKWLERSGPAPLWLIAQHERECCVVAQPGEECAHKGACSQRSACPAKQIDITVLRFSAYRCARADEQPELSQEAAQHIVNGGLAVIRAETYTAQEARQ